ncbi:MAG: hypothetical protein E7582_00065 [Ruminococcaceae bacterium]|nr:hypothetical protein [Oscillospiraceae bacterium]
MIWATYATLGYRMWTYRKAPKSFTFEEEAWKSLVRCAKDKGLNMIILDLGEGVQWKSHPEISIEGAWSHEKVKEEVLRLREMGIELIPKMNFSACHHLWLGEYRLMMCTHTYYTVCRDLIEEAYEMFLHPSYIHLGMDEEGSETQFKIYDHIVNYRKGDIYWHDYKYLTDCVRELGATPWVWGDSAIDDYEGFRKAVTPEDDLIVNPWWYHAWKEEHFNRLDSREDWFCHLKTHPELTYFEELHARTMEGYRTLAKDGYKLVPCGSFLGRDEWCFDDLLDEFRGLCKKENLLGFMTAPWRHTRVENIPLIEEDFEYLRKAREKYFPENK